MKILNKTTYIGLLAAAILGLSSCESFLEEENYTNLVSESYLTEDNADEMVVGAYQSLRSVYKSYDLLFMGTDIFTQQGEFISYNALNEYFNITDGNGSVGSYWRVNYELVSNANVAINRYSSDVDWSESNLGKKAQGIAEARVLRALGYFNLVRQYGGVVLVLDETTSIRADYTRSSEQECYVQIIKDIEESIADLELSPASGRLSQKAAQHLLAEVYLTRGYTSFAGTDDFATAASLAENAIGNYDLLSQSFAELFAYDNQVNDEILLSVQYGTGTDYDDRNNNKHGIMMNQVINYPGISRDTPYGMKSHSAMPTEFFYSLFEANDTREAVTIHRVLYASEEAIVTNDGVGADTIAIGDTVIYYPKTALSDTELKDKLNRYYVYQPDQYYYGLQDNIDGVIYQYSANLERTNFPIFAKFDDVDFDESEGGSRDAYVFRVAESHLIAAEAYLKDGQSDKALAHINKVRQRATGVVDHYAALTIDDILNERAVELAGEGNRWAVLKRTGKLEERINAYNPHVIDHGEFDAAEHLTRPIPEHETNLSDGSLVQDN